MFESIPVDDEAARALADAVRHVHGAFRSIRTQVIASAGLHLSEFDALVAIGEARGMTAKDLAAAAGLTTSATTALVDRLSALGLMQRSRHPRDRRSVVVTLAPRGEALITAIYRDHVDRFAPMLTADACSEERLPALLDALHHIAATLTLSAPGRTALTA